MTYLEELKETVKKELSLSAYKELQSIKYLTKRQYKTGKHWMRYLKYMDYLNCDNNSNIKFILKRINKLK